MLNYKTMKPYLALARPSNSPTVISNIVVSATLASFYLDALNGYNLFVLVITIASGLSAYFFGMVFNDLVDVKKDKLDGKKRPLVTGEISQKNASILAASLAIFSLAGYALLLFLVDIYKLPKLDFILTLSSIGLVFVSIVFYNLLHNRLQYPQLLMGACRFFLILASFLILSNVPKTQEDLPFSFLIFAYAAIVFIYTVALSTVARSKIFSEVKSVNPIAQLLAGFCIIDFLVLIYMQEYNLSLVCLVGYFATLILQPLFRGT